MLDRLIRAALAHRVWVLGLSLVVLAAGLFTAARLPVEVLPDLTKPTVTILTEAPGLAPEEVETRVTQPLESALLGIPGLTRLRSNSDVSLSLIAVEFDWGSDPARNRLLVQERLQTARDVLPGGVTPFLTPPASLMGEILLVGVRSKIPPGQPGHLTAGDVRVLADWVIRRRLQSIPGIAEVLNMGGGIRQIEIQPDPWKLQAWQVSLEELESAAARAVTRSTGGFLDRGTTEIMIRNLASTTDLDAIASTAIRATGDRTVAIRDVADVVWGTEPMRGDAGVSRTPENDPTRGVIMSITKAQGFDTRRLTEAVRRALDELQPSLPEGVETVVLFQQKDFINRAMGNLQRAILEAAVMVTLVLVIFLLNVRTTVITLVAIPMSFAITMLAFRWLGISVNSMTLGGLAVAMGMVVDDAIVDVENVFRRLRENAARTVPRPRLEVIASASTEVRSSIFYATVLIILVFVPLLGLSGVEGRLFAPIAVATIVSMVASFVVSLTLIPALCSWLLTPRSDHRHRDGWLVRRLKALLEATALRVGLDHPGPVLLLVLAGAGAVFALYPGMGKDFLPVFREETVLVAATSAPGTSLAQMNELSDALERQILAGPEVRVVGRRIGRAERGDHVVPVSTVEFDVDFRGDGGRPRAAVLDDLRQRVRTVPGVFATLSGPLADRIGHMLSGVSAPVAVKLYGPDLEVLRQLGTQIRDIAKSIPGLEEAKLDQQSLIPQLRIEPDRARAAAHGLAPGAVTDPLSALLGGRPVAELQDGGRTLRMVVRLPEHLRSSVDTLRVLPVTTGSGRSVPLSAVADIHEAQGPNVIFRENGQRRFTVAIKPTTPDVARLVEELRDRVAREVKLPEGTFVTFEGEFQARADASRRILWLSAGIFLAIVFLLTGYFRSVALALQVLLNIPLALVGGLALTWLLVGNISIATLVGFIAVGGIAARNGIMMISHYLHLLTAEGESFTRAMVVRGTLERMVPVLMTALAAGIALLPFVFAANEPGKEILHPVAVVIVGGLLSSTLLDFLVTPLVFFHFARGAALRSIGQQPNPTNP